MSGLGVLENIRPADRFESDAVTPARPGGADPSTIVTKRSKSRTTDITDLIANAAERARDRAQRQAEINSTSTTLTALAQAHAVLGESRQAADAARDAIQAVESAAGSDGSIDSTSLRLAVEVLMQFDDSSYAYEVLRRNSRSRPLRILFSMLTFQKGEVEEALAEIADLDDSLAEAVKGYIFATVGEHQRAIGHLRHALRDHPNDPDSLLNLSISLAHVGADQKAMKAALQATRVAPGRKDVSMHYMRLLLEQGAVDAVEAEVRALKARQVVECSDFLVVQARVLIQKGEPVRAIPVLTTAAEAAEREGDEVTRGEILANLATIRYDTSRLTHVEVVQRMQELLKQFPTNDAVVVHYARFADRSSQAPILRLAVDRVRSRTTPLRLAYLRHQLAYLEGDNESAANAAADWYAHEPDNPMAAAAAIVALGIGMERWSEALVVARDSLARHELNTTLINNAAYIIAINGDPRVAIDLLEPIAADNFVLNATLGLAHLANGNVSEGMRRYRSAADHAEKVDPVWRSLMTAYQALVVRQLGLLDTVPREVIEAHALVPFDLPEDWKDRPEFVRLWNVAKRSGYGWPLAL